MGEPAGWNARPRTADRDAYRHNCQAARSYRNGPYHRPGLGGAALVLGRGSAHTRLGRPRIVADYWLCAPDLPPAGCQSVRYGTDAVSISIDSGKIF